MALVSGMAVGVVIVLLAWLINLNLEQAHNADRMTTAPKTAPIAPVRTVTVAPRSTPPAAQAKPKATGDVRLLPDGLYCKDLQVGGYGYAAAVNYWRLHGQSNRMDADRNGIPCETVYPRSEVGAYWNGREPTAASGVPAGLFCRDLLDRGAPYGEAVAYWWSFGMPGRMDADGNGIPCETVYPEAAIRAFWSQ
ncbi:hypothetical protein FB561_1528 [Kribbella amoyensis]|uniref:Excalibur calcium-binding domain-containing protein n=1 Tax=Kribbella amoyensis TaxID=996641 RepID=A0A561BNT3_9ACTN|nr:hypothetical protein FB561_1528 [Kribbella amoyensis]